MWTKKRDVSHFLFFSSPSEEKMFWIEIRRTQTIAFWFAPKSLFRHLSMERDERWLFRPSRKSEIWENFFFLLLLFCPLRRNRILLQFWPVRDRARGWQHHHYCIWSHSSYFFWPKKKEEKIYNWVVFDPIAERKRLVYFTLSFIPTGRQSSYSGFREREKKAFIPQGKDFNLIFERCFEFYYHS